MHKVKSIAFDNRTGQPVSKDWLINKRRQDIISLGHMILLKLNDLPGDSMLVGSNAKEIDPFPAK